MFTNIKEKKTNEFVAKVTNESDKSKIVDYFRDKTAAEKGKKLAAWAAVLGFICNAISFLSASTFVSIIIYSLSFAAVGHWFAVGLSVVIGIGFSIVIEYLKTDSTTNTIKEFLQYRKVRKDLLLTAIFTITLSIVLSFFGAKYVPQATAAAVVSINVDSIKQSFESKIKQTTILHTYKANNTLTKQGAAAVAELEKEKRNEIATAAAANEKAAAANDSEIQSNELLFCSIAAANEIILLLCLLLVINYKFNCYIEAIADSEPQTTNEPLRATFLSESEPRQAPQAKQKIGFFVDNNDNRNEGNINENSSLRTCENCHTKYVHKHHKQKYCKDACRIEAWGEKTGKKLTMKAAQK